MRSEFTLPEFTLPEVCAAQAPLDFAGNSDLVPEPGRVARLVAHLEAMDRRHDTYEAMRFDEEFGVPSNAEILAVHYVRRGRRAE